MSTSSIGSCNTTKTKEEDDAILCEDYYKLGCQAENNGLIFEAKKHFSSVSKLAQTDDLKETVQKRLEHLNSTFCPSERSVNINLANFSILNDENLEPFLHNKLSLLNLSDCPNITKKSIIAIAEKCVKLQKLFLINCTNVTSIEKGHLVKSAITFRELEYLDISDCLNLKTLRLKAPKLKLLEADNNKELKILDLNAPLSVSIKADNSPNLNIETFEKLFGITKLIRIAKELKSNYCKFILKLFYPSMKDVILNTDIEDKIPGKRLIKTLLDQIDNKKEFIKELQTDNSLSELKFTVNKEDNTKEYPMFFGMILQFAYDPNKRTSQNDFKAIKNHPIEATILLAAKALEINSVISKLDLSSCMIGKSVGILEYPFKNNCTITKLDLSDNNIEEEFMFLANVLKDSPIQYLNLRSNRITAKGIAVLAKFLKTNKTLSYLDLSENQLGGNIANCNAVNLGEAIKKNSALSHLKLSGNKFNYLEASSLTKLSLEKNKTLTSLDLSANEIGFYGMSLIFQGLEKNKTLTSLDLSSNQIECNNIKRIQLLISSLKNSAIEELDLSENKITEDAQQGIKQIEEQIPKLKITITFAEFTEKKLDSLKKELNSED